MRAAKEEAAKTKSSTKTKGKDDLVDIYTTDLKQLEEKEAEEVMDQPIEGVTTRNFYFDRTVSRLITGIITEQGLMGRREIKHIVSS